VMYQLENTVQTEKIVFAGGPRQVGKTTPAREFVAPHFGNAAYYNWDSRKDRRGIMRSTGSERPGVTHALGDFFCEPVKYSQGTSFSR
jgi:hypothetical protein